MRIRGLLGGLIGIFILGMAVSSWGQGNELPIVEINAQDTFGLQGSQVCVEFPVKNFDNIQSIQFSIHFDPTVMTPICPPDGSLSGLPGLSPTNFNCNEIEKGFIRMVWLDPDNGTNCGASIPDGENIFQICFTLTGQPGTISPIYIAGDQLPVEYSQIPDCNDVNTFIDIRNTTVTIGTVTILCGSLSVFEGKCDSAPGQNTGSFNFYPCGGTGPYTYSVNGGAFTGSIQNEREQVFISDLAPGNYSVIITDADGSTATSNTVTIAEGSTIDVNALITPPTCYDRSNGVIEVLEITGGTGPYTTVWDNFLFDSLQYRRLSNGEYDLTITDAVGCRVVETFEVLRDTITVAAQVISDATCPGATDGVIELVASGGNPYPGNAYVYNNRPPVDTFAEVNAPEGWYYYQVTDASTPTCRSTEDSIFVGTQRNISTDPTVMDITCFGETDGSIFVNGIGSTDFSFTFLDSNRVNIGNFCRNNRLVIECFDLPEGEYFVVTTDNVVGCIKEDTFNISEPDSLLVGFTSIDPTCRGADGSIEITAQGGTTTNDFTITWSDGGSGISRSNLSGGTYDITVEDDNGCQKLLNVVLTPPVLIQIEAVVDQNVMCQDGNDGSLTVNVQTVGEYAYRWTQNGDTVGTDQTATGLTPGGYEVIVIDTVLACQARDSVFLNNPAGISLTANYTLPLCPFPDFTTGSIGIVASGGSGNYTYLWDDSSTNSTRASIAAGDYAVTITDDRGCAVDSIFTLENPEAIQVTLDDITGVRCFGQDDGEATAMASGGTVNNGRYSFFWSSGAMDIDFALPISRADDLPAGRNYVIVTDATCPSDTIFFDVPDIEPLSLNDSLTTVADPLCFGDCSGSITAIAQGGNDAFYRYQWMFDGSMSPTLSNICSGNYRVLITDDNSCTVMDSVILTDPDSLAVNVDDQTTIDPNCFNAGEAQIGVLATGGIPTYSYNWTDSISTTTIASGLDDGNYFVTVTDANGCTAITNYILASPSPIQAVIPTPEPPVCFGGTTCVEVISVTGGSGENYTYTVNRGIRFPIDSCIDVFAGPYTVTVFDGDGCSEEYTVEVGQPAQLLVDVGPDLTVSLGESTEPVNVDIDAVFNILSIDWTPVDSLICLSSDCQVVRMAPQSTTSYTVIVTDENGCTAQDDLTVEVSKRRNIYAANVFSPNRDGTNDYFQLVAGPGVQVISEFMIFDRWGQPVWHQENYLPDGSGTDGWDGTINQKEALPGVYAYVARVRFIDNQEILLKGSITLLR